MKIRRNKSKKRRAGDAVAKYVKFKAVSKAVRSAPKKAWLGIAGGAAGGAALMARRRRSQGPSAA